MPADYASTARALSLPVDDDDDDNDMSDSRRSASFNGTPAWHRRSASLTHSLSQARPLDPNASSFERATATLDTWGRRGLAFAARLTLVQQILAAAVLVALLTGLVLFLVYGERVFEWAFPYLEWWGNEVPFGWVVLWLATVLVSFPPMIGYSTLVTLAGFVYGMQGWFIIASATLIGSTLSFLASRTLLAAWVHRLLQHDTRFAALALTLKHDGFKLLLMIRLCPLPYSLSNGACATFPSVTWYHFALATAMVSPKLLVHIFIGSRLRAIVGGDGTMDGKTRALNWASIVFGLVVGSVTGYLIWRQTKKRAAELEALEVEAGRRPGSGYSDEGRVEDALRRHPSDISLRAAEEDPFGEEIEDEYRDESESEGRK